MDGVAHHRLSVCTVTSYLNSGPSQNLLFETAFLTHFSLGFLLFMMKSFVKERKIKYAVKFQENFHTNPFSYFKCEVHGLGRVLAEPSG